MAYRHHTGEFDKKFHSVRDRREIEDMLGEWYGKEFAASEITARTPEPRMLADLLDELMKQKLDESAQQFMQLQEQWAEIIGAPLNKFTRVASVQEHKALVEVAHPAFLLELRKPAVSDLWIKKLNAAFPALEIREIIFMPTGQRLRD